MTTSMSPTPIVFPISGDITTFFVVKFDDLRHYPRGLGKDFRKFPSAQRLVHSTQLAASRVPIAVTARTRTLGSSTAGALRAGIYQVVGFDMAGTNLTHYLAAQATGSGPITATLADADTPLRIGTRDDLFTKMKGDIAEILIYSSALSVADRAAVVDYLARNTTSRMCRPRSVSASLLPGQRLLRAKPSLSRPPPPIRWLRRRCAIFREWRPVRNGHRATVHGRDWYWRRLARTCSRRRPSTTRALRLPPRQLH
jgi:hypothetical protein